MLFHRNSDGCPSRELVCRACSPDEELDSRTSAIPFQLPSTSQSFIKWINTREQVLMEQMGVEHVGTGRCCVRYAPVSTKVNHHCSGIVMGCIFWAKEFPGALQGHGQRWDGLPRSVAQTILHHIHVMIPEPPPVVVYAVSTAGGRELETSSHILIERTVGYNLGPSEEEVGYGADAPSAVGPSVWLLRPHSA